MLDSLFISRVFLFVCLVNDLNTCSFEEQVVSSVMGVTPIMPQPGGAPESGPLGVCLLENMLHQKDGC